MGMITGGHPPKQRLHLPGCDPRLRLSAQKKLVRRNTQNLTDPADRLYGGTHSAPFRNCASDPPGNPDRSEADRALDGPDPGAGPRPQSTGGTAVRCSWFTYTVGTAMKKPSGTVKQKAVPDGFLLFQKDDQYASFFSSQLFSSLMGTRTCSMVSRSRMVTALSAGVLSSPTVWKSTVMQ